MFRVVPQGIETSSLAHYSTCLSKEVGGLVSQNIYYDAGDEFGSSLNVLASPEQFISLSFMYHPKDGKGSTLIFHMVNKGDKMGVFCSDNQYNIRIYDLLNTVEKCALLTKNIISVNESREKSDKYTEGPQLRDMAKEVLQKFASIARAVLKSDNLTDYPLNMAIKVFELEASKFQSIFEIAVAADAPKI